MREGNDFLSKGMFFIWSPVFLAAGVGLYFTLLFEPFAYLWAVLGVLSVGGFAVARYWERVRYGIIALSLIGLGFAAAQFHTQRVYTPILHKKVQPVSVSGRVELIEALEKGQRITLSEVALGRFKPENTPRKIRIKFRKEQAAYIGDRIEVLAGLNPPSAPVLPGGFDFQRFMFFKGIGATGFAYGDLEVVGEKSSSGFFSFVEGLRLSIVAKVDRALDGRGSAVVSALMTGHRSGITEEDREAMRDAGLAHMLAISGLHVGLFSGAFFFCVRLFLVAVPGMALRYPVKKYAAIAGIIAAVFYMFIAGMSVPTQRAALMSSIVFLAIIMDRSPISLRLVSFAALVVLLFEPESLLSASFQLSFAAVFALVSFYEEIRGWWSGMYRQSGFLRRAGLYVLGVCLTTVIATLATTPLALYHFQHASLYGLLGNILAMPVLSFIVMPAALVSFLLMPLGLEGLVLPIMGWGVGMVLDIAHFVSGLEYSVWNGAMWPAGAFLAYACGFVCLVLLQGRMRLACVVPFLVCVVMILSAPRPFLLVSSHAKLIAYMDESSEQMVFSSYNKERFAREVWMRSFGLSEEQRAKFPKEGVEENIACGEDGCRIEHRNIKVDVLNSASGFKEACMGADMIIVRELARGSCEGKVVIDKFDTIYRGSHAVYMSSGGLRYETSEGLRGKRPWTISYQKARFSDKSGAN